MKTITIALLKEIGRTKKFTADALRGRLKHWHPDESQNLTDEQLRNSIQRFIRRGWVIMTEPGARNRFAVYQRTEKFAQARKQLAKVRATAAAAEPLEPLEAPAPMEALWRELRESMPLPTDPWARIDMKEVNA